MNDLSTQQIQAYWNKLLQQGLSPLILKRKLASVALYLKWLKEQGKIPDSSYQLFESEKEKYELQIAKLEWEKKSTIEKVREVLLDKKTEVENKINRASKSQKSSPTGDSRFSQFGVRHYLAGALLLLFIALLGAGAYNQFFNKASTPFAFPSSLTRGNRTLSFQGRLLDVVGNPIITQSDIVFKLYNVPTGGSALYTFSCTGGNGVTPDEDGIFSTLIGDDCNQTQFIPDNVFTDYPNVYLGVTVGADSEMTPRQHIANVGYAMNAETLQGFPPGTSKYNIPYINSQGDLLIATSAAGLRSTWETADLTLSSAKDLLLNSGDPDLSGGDIIAQASSSASVIRFKTGTTDRIFVDSTTNGGNVGIGTTTPSTFKLEVGGSVGPSANDTYDLGSATRIWNDAYVDRVCFDGGSDCMTSGSPWTDAGTYLYPTNGEVLGNSASAGSNKLAGIYLADSSPLYFGTDNDINASFNNGTSTLNFTQGSNDINFDANTLFIDGSADRVGIGVTNPQTNLEVVGNANTFIMRAPTASSYGSFRIYNDQNNASRALELGYTGSSYAGFGGLTGEFVYLSATGSYPIGLGDNTNLLLIVDNSNDKVGIGTTGPDRKLDILDASSPQLRLTYTDGSVYTDLQTNSSGYLYVNTSGGRTGIGTSSPLETLDVNGNATVSGNLTLYAGARSIQTTAFNGLTIGGASTGNITLDPKNAAAGGFVAPATTNVTDLGQSGLQFRNLYAQVLYQNGNLVCDATGANCPAGSSLWTDGGAYLYPTSGEVLGNNTSGGSNKIAGIYLADSSPLYFGTDNDINASFNNSTSTLNFTQGSNDINFDANTLFIDGSANRVGIGTTTPGTNLDVASQIRITNDTTVADSGTSGAYGALRLRYNNWTGGHGANIQFDIGQYDSAGNVIRSELISGGGSGVSDLIFYGKNSVSVAQGAVTEYMRIKYGGAVGVGISSPIGELHVSRDQANGALGKALGIFDQTENQDIITASASAVKKFAVTNGGNIQSAVGAKWLPFSDSTTALNIANSSGTSFVTYDSSNSRVGIGTTTPNNLLHVYMNASGANYIKVENATAASAADSVGLQLTSGAETSYITYAGQNDNLRFWVDGGSTPAMTLLADGSNNGTGSLGIGTVSPGKKLEVVDNTTAQLRLAYTNGSVYTDFQTDSSGNLTIDATGTKSIVADDLQVTGNDILDSSAATRLTLGATTTLTNTALNLTGTATLTNSVAMAWDLANSSTTALNIEGGLMNFDTSNSRVGIGLTNPSYKLDVKSGSVSDILRLDGSGGVTNLVFSDSGTDKWKLIQQASNRFSFNYQTAENVSFLSGGNVGIGTTSPIEKLDVAGNATVSGNLTLAGSGRTIATRALTTLTLGDSQTGDIYLQPKGSVGAVVQIGSGGAGSTTPDVFGLDVKSDSGDPTIGFNGAIYYNANSNKFRCYENGAWTNCVGSGTLTGSGATGQATFWTGTSTLSGGNQFSWDNTNKKFALGFSSVNQGLGEFHVTRTLADGALGKALAIFDQTEDQDILTASASGITKLTVTNSGSLVFNQASTISANSGALTLQPASGSNLNVSLAGTGDLAVNTNQLYVDTSASSVGIGTTTPRRTLDVLNTSNPQMRLTYTDNSVYTDFQTDSSGNLTIDGTGTKSIIADDLQVTGNNILDSSATSRVTLGATTTLTNTALNLTGTATLTSNTALAWDLANSSTTALNIESGLLNLDTQNSRVGIGTSGPSGLLHVNGSAGNAYFTDTAGGGFTVNIQSTVAYSPSRLKLGGTGSYWDMYATDNGGGSGAYLLYNRPNPNGLQIGSNASNASTNLQLGFFGSGSSNTAGIGFVTIDGATSGTRMFITSNGRVGIGTTSPLELLDVSGNATVSGNLALYGGARSIQTTAANHLTIGGSSTGNITLNPKNAAAGGFVAPNTTNVTDLGASSSLQWRNIYGQALFQNGNSVCDSTGSGCPASTTRWNTVLDPNGNQSLTMAAYTSTWGWTSSAGLDGLTANFNNNSGSSTTQNMFVLNNAAVGSFTDTNTESLILLQQLDTTAAGTTVLENALKIDAAANSGITNGIQVTNSAGNVATGLLIADTVGGTLTTGISMTGTFTNYIDTPNFDVANSGNITVAASQGIDTNASGALKLGATTATSVDIGRASQTINFTSPTWVAASASTLDLANSSTTALNIESGLLNLDTQNSRVGIGTTAPGAKLDVESIQTSGTVTKIGAPSSVSLAGTLTGLNLDLSTNYTATGFSLNGQTIALPAVTNTGGGSYSYKGQTITGGALVQNTGAGTNTWIGTEITMPNITQTTGSVTSTGLKIIGGTVTSGTAYGFVTDANAGNVGIGTTTPTSNFQVARKTSDFNSNNDATLQTWSTSGQTLPANRANASAASANGYIYVTGGETQILTAAAQVATVYYTRLNNDGETGGWMSTTALPANRASHASIAVNGYLYVIGGRSADTVATGTNTVYYAKINSDGTVGAWNTTSTIPTSLSQLDITTANGYMYLAGGYNTSSVAQTAVYYAKINSDGTLGTWVTNANSLGTARRMHKVTVANGRLYAIGGVSQNDTEKALINSDGSIGTWSTNGNTMPAARANHVSAVADGNLYVISGGTNGSDAGNTTVYYATLNSDGTTGSWSTDTASPIPAARATASSVNANGYIYVIGGATTAATSTAGTDTVYFSSTARVRLAGALDLIGLTNPYLASASGQTASTLYAGNIFSNNNLSVGGYADLWNGLSVTGGLSSYLTSPLTTASTQIANQLTFADTGIVTTGTDTSYGNYISMTRTGATGGTINTYGEYINLVTDNAGSGTHTGYGLFVNIDGNTDNDYAGVFMGGNVGIGTSTPTQRLDVAGPVRLGANGNANDVLNTTSGSAPSGDLFWGSRTLCDSTNNCLSGLQTRWNNLQNPTGNLSLTMSTNTTTFNWATGTSTNNLFSLTTDASANGTGALLNIQTGSSATVLPLRVRAGSVEGITVDAAGEVGIGTTAPTNKLEVAGDIRAALLCDTSDANCITGGTPTYFVDVGNSGTSLKIFGDQTFVGGGLIDTGGNNTLTLDTGTASLNVEGGSNGGNVTMCVSFDGSSSCDGKIDVGTVDPPYTINGKKYATYMASMTGVKEETTGQIQTTEYIPGLGYRAVINFSKQPDGSDLWLFSKATNLKTNIDKMVTLLTAQQNTRTWYKVDRNTYSLYIYSNKPTTVAYRLTAPRFDYEKWANVTPNGSTGFVVNDPDGPQTVALNEYGNIPPTPGVTGNSNYVYDGTLEGSENYVNSLGYQLTNGAQEMVEEISIASKGVFATITSGLITTQNAVVKNILTAQTIVAKRIQITEKITSPIVQTTHLNVEETATITKVETNEIQPKNQDLTINLAPSPTTNHQSPTAGSLAKLIIKGLEGKTVAVVDNAGNASFSGTLAAKDASISGTIAAEQGRFNEASISGNLIAKEIKSETIDVLNQKLARQTAAVEEQNGKTAAVNSQINDIQQFLAELQNQPLPDPEYYQNLPPQPITNNQQLTTTLEQLTVTGNSNLYNLSVSGTALVGQILVDNNSIVSLASDLRLSALNQITLFDGKVTIAKDGTITTSGSLIAQGGIKTNTLQPVNEADDINVILKPQSNGTLGSNAKLNIKNTLGEEVASIDASGSARLNKVTAASAYFKNGIAVDKYLEASESGSLIAANENLQINGIASPAFETGAKTAGAAILPQNETEVIIYNQNIKENSLIYLTPETQSSAGQLVVAEKNIHGKTYFKVSVDSSLHPNISFNWLIIN